MTSFKNETSNFIIDSAYSDMKCRACLAFHNDGKYLFQNELCVHFTDCTTIRVAIGDGYPEYICVNCYDLINKFYSFKQQCFHSQALLEKETVTIKEETPENFDYSNTDSSRLEDPTIEQVLKNANDDKNIFLDHIGISDDDNDSDFEPLLPRNKDKTEDFMSKPFKCDHCAKCFNSYRWLERHMKVHIKLECAEIEFIKAENQTEQTEIIKKKSKKHKLKKSKTNKSKFKKLLAPNKVEVSKDRTQLTCPTCNQRFFKYKKLEDHMRAHFGLQANGLPCEVCGKILKHANSLKNHMVTHSTERNHKCPTCSKTFAHKNALYIHERIHAGIKKYVCDICGHKFNQVSNLQVHLQRHNDNKPHACKTCNKTFKLLADMKKHQLRHDGIKKFPCSQCNLGFYSNHELVKHMPFHTGQRPYACDVCGKTFKTKSFVTVHKRNHTGERPFECDFCPQKFKSSKDLRNHRMRHTGEKPHKCQFCAQAFIQKTALNRHMKGHNKHLIPNPAILASQIRQDSIPAVNLTTPTPPLMLNAGVYPQEMYADGNIVIKRTQLNMN